MYVLGIPQRSYPESFVSLSLFLADYDFEKVCRQVGWGGVGWVGGVG